MPVKKTTESKELSIIVVKEGSVSVKVLGKRPEIQNRLAEKAKRELLLPSLKKNATERATTMKHRPYEEFAASPHRFTDPNAPTYLGIPCAAFKKAMMTAALDLPGTKKAQIGRLLWVEGDLTPQYGIPQIMVSAVRSADINRTPDIRTRVVVPQWAAEIQVRFVDSLIKQQMVLNLLHAAGMYIGVGDWRNEKGSNTYGAFRLVSNEEDLQLYEQIVATGGREEQLAAMKTPQAFDDETSELLEWFDAEVARRQLKGVS